MTEPTPPAPHPAIDPRALPFGVAPIAAVPRGRSRRRRLVDAAIASSTLAALPLASMVSRPEADPRPADPLPSLTEAVDLFAAGDGAAVRAAVLEEGITPAPAPGDRTSPNERTEPAPAGPAPGGAPATNAPADPGPTTPPARTVAEPTAPTPIATVGGVELLVPSLRTVLVGFHEASKPGTDTMTSMAPLSAEHTTRDVPVVADPVEQQVAPVVSLPSRARPQAPSSAIDIAIPEGEDVLAPVSGRVVMASPYSLYGRYGDWRIEIEPDGHPGTRLIMIHVDDVKVALGDRVEAGRTVIAGTANLFPFESQIDRFTAEVTGGAPTPHTHVEVKRVP